MKTLEKCPNSRSLDEELALKISTAWDKR
jgi:hypothetical protein